MAYYYSPFRKKYSKRKTAGCVFCDQVAMTIESVPNAKGKPVENDSYRWVVNMFPKFEGHTLAIPKRHITSIGSESPR